MLLGNDWDEVLKDEWDKPYFLQLCQKLGAEYSKGYKIYPERRDIFNAFKYTTFADTKVVILGQDPYHGGQADGLCFSVKDSLLPPSLKNIFKEIETEYNNFLDTSQNNADNLPINLSDSEGFLSSCGDLSRWASQGVLLLNTVLTVKAHCANSHWGYGWETFTDGVIKKLNDKDSPIVFLLWGSNAKQKSSLITNPIHYVLKAAHPSPLSAHNGFFGCGHFLKTNQILTKHALTPIQWWHKYFVKIKNNCVSKFDNET